MSFLKTLGVWSLFTCGPPLVMILPGGRISAAQGLVVLLFFLVALIGAILLRTLRPESPCGPPWKVTISPGICHQQDGRRNRQTAIWIRRTDTVLEQGTRSVRGDLLHEVHSKPGPFKPRGSVPACPPDFSVVGLAQGRNVLVTCS